MDINADCVTYCSWAGMPPFFSRYTADGQGDPALGARVYSAVTGIDISHDEMMAAMSPICNIERCIHVREGRRRKDDTYNEATFKSPAWASMSREEFDSVMDLYYTLRGWDPATGIPRRSTLDQQGLGRIADDLETRYGVAVPA